MAKACSQCGQPLSFFQRLNSSLCSACRAQANNPFAKPERGPFTNEALGKSLDIGFKQATEAGASFKQQIAAMTEAGCPELMAYWFANLVPILAGRRFMKESSPMPKLADHYVTVDDEGNERAVRFAECPLVKAAEKRLDRLGDLEIMTIGLRSCEFQAMNAALNQLGPKATPDVIPSITIEAPRMRG